MGYNLEKIHLVKVVPIKRHTIGYLARREIMRFGKQRIVVNLFQQDITEIWMSDTRNGQGFVAYGQTSQVSDTIFRHHHHTVIGRSCQTDAGRI